MQEIETPLDQLSNKALDAIKGRRYDEAEKLCQRLLREYPEVPDGQDRLAMLRASQERFQEAADHYAQALKIIQQEPEGFDQETINYYTLQRDQALAKVKK